MGAVTQLNVDSRLCINQAPDSTFLPCNVRPRLAANRLAEAASAPGPTRCSSAIQVGVPQGWGHHPIHARPYGGTKVDPHQRH